ncbi:hypothetical protein GH714_020890 [Hevea brasiliensis]|uniref:NERD domain-containing protein n=1 Tax=Hevea brasiliensis TaxID=3981 RepID=A0A6A6M2I2_HEVBR|nr:hypothetical protein GH714_020890 [Hevea brasiliensis]
MEILCGLIIYKLYRRFFSDDDDLLEVESSDTTALFNVANRLEKLYGGKVYVGLRIPDADTGSRQNVDMVLVTKGEAVVISVKNLSGLVTISGDGSWVCESSKHKAEHFPDPLKPEPKGMFSGWIKGAFRGGKKDMQESIHEKLNFTLSTAPMWDRKHLHYIASSQQFGWTIFA